jgi:hypothetical protein
MSIQQDWQDPQSQKRGMSSGSKVLLILGGVGGLFLLLCCGGLAIVGYKFKEAVGNLVTTDPELIKTRTQDIVTIEVPPGFKPVQAMDMVVMRMVVYNGDGGDQSSVFMIMEFDKTMMQGNKKQQQDQMLQQMRAQQAQQGSNGDIQVEETQTREFTIAGRKTEFSFVKGKSNDGKAVRQVTGSFPTVDGVAMLFLMVPEEKYDEAAIDRMLQSIQVPASAGEAEVEDMDENAEAENNEAAGATTQPDPTGATKPDESGEPEAEKSEDESNS